jgi:hypothetical protein
MTAHEQHLARLRELQRRYNACEESGNEAGAEQIQKLIDAENQRWSAQQAA